MLLVGSPANYIRGGKARRDNLYFFLSLIWLTAVVGALIFALLMRMRPPSRTHHAVRRGRLRAFGATALPLAGCRPRNLGRAFRDVLDDPKLGDFL